ncbi:hypothetical protein QMA80_04480 [Burkholderia pseudomallei]|uniref:hypothetical protein n=1 Tax=Burkholderia pseudomallei TaxID=28450 RepID=UPI002DB9237D|nr:hypothetical protein [Burkholderia pseudomallei]MEB5496201.1 hypothetical protein [Burkholderia pseudomallei]
MSLTISWIGVTGQNAPSSTSFFRKRRRPYFFPANTSVHSALLYNEFVGTRQPNEKVRPSFQEK